MSSVSDTPSAGLDPAKEVTVNLRKSFIKGLIIPVIVLIFFWFAPAWLNQRIPDGIYKGIDASANLNPVEKIERRAVFEGIDFASPLFPCTHGTEVTRSLTLVSFTGEISHGLAPFLRSEALESGYDVERGQKSGQTHAADVVNKTVAQ